MSDYDFDRDEQTRIVRALTNLTKGNEAWRSNLNYYTRISAYARYVWYERIKQQAKQGLPMARTLISEVIALRLTS